MNFNQMKITVIDTRWGTTDQPNLLRIEEFSFKKQFVKKRGYKKTVHSYDNYAINADGSFLIGLLPRIKEHCSEHNIQLEIEDESENNHNPIPQGISSLFTLREDQKRLISSALTFGRGVLQAPTGSGKTVLISATISAFPNARILFLCHTISLLKQTQEEFNRFNLGRSTIVNGINKDLNGQIIISTIQSFSKDKILNQMNDKFDIIYIDECHRVSSTTGLYAKALTKLTAPIIIGVTATLPTKKEAQLALEGLIGPVIGHLTFAEAIDKEILAVPKIKLLPVPTCEAIHDLRLYSNTKQKDERGNYILDENGNHVIIRGIYDTGIVEYRKRNRIIIEAAIDQIKQGKSVLIYVVRIDHGERLVEISERLGIEIVFVRGSTGNEYREAVRKSMDAKKTLLTCATVAWSEGINIRSLDTIIIAGGGKSEKDLIQKCGRGLRRTEEKKEALIIDLLDNGKYISQHCIERIKIYAEKGWI